MNEHGISDAAAEESLPHFVRGFIELGAFKAGRTVIKQEAQLLRDVSDLRMQCGCQSRPRLVQDPPTEFVKEVFVTLTQISVPIPLRSSRLVFFVGQCEACSTIYCFQRVKRGTRR